MEHGTPETKDFENLLSSFREAGRLDSRGSFTLAGAKAAGKLAQSLLPNAADWILKIVQSACQAQAAELRISQTRRATHIEFKVPYQIDIRALEESLIRAHTATQPGLEDLCTALRVLGLGQKRSWAARLNSGELTHWILVQDGEASLESIAGQSGEKGVTEVLLGIAFPPGESGKLGGLVRFGAAIQNEHEALLHRARACPIPLWLDGIRIDTLESKDPLSGLEHEFFLGVCLGNNLQRPQIQLPSGLETKKASPLRDPLASPGAFHLAASNGESQGSSLMRIAFRYHHEHRNRHSSNLDYKPLATPSRVLLVRHGVVVGKRNLGLSESIAVDVYLDSGDSRVDLSGLQVEVLPEHMDAARDELRGIGDFLTLVEQKIASHPCKSNPRDLLLHGSLNTVCLLIAPWPLKLATLGLSFVQLRFLLQRYKRLVTDCRFELTHFQQKYCTPAFQPEQLPPSSISSAAG